MTVPSTEFPPGTPFTIQFTAVLLVPETVAANCCDCPTCRLALAGETLTDKAGAVGEAVSDTWALADAVDCTTLCAVMVIP